MSSTQITITKSCTDAKEATQPIPISNRGFLSPQYSYPGSTCFNAQYSEFSPDQFNVTEAVVPNQYLMPTPVWPSAGRSPTTDEFGYLSASPFSQDEFVPYATSPLDEYCEFQSVYSNRSLSPYPDSMYFSDRSISPMPSECHSQVTDDCFYPNQTAEEKENRERKRRRRKHNQIDRKYACDFATCSKSYGTVTHLNTHRIQKGHGDRLTKADFF